MEVARGHDLAVGHDDRVVDHRPELGGEDLPGKAEHVPDRPVHLRRAAQAVRVLHRMPAVPVAGQQRRPGQQPAQVGRADQLPRMRPQRLDPLVVGPVGAEQRLDRQRAGQVGRLDQHAAVVDREGQQRLHRLGPVDQRQALLGGQRQRLEPVGGQHLGGREAAGRAAGDAQQALADQRLSQMRELGQVTGGAHRALARDHRQQVQGQQLEQPRGQLGPHPRVAGRQRPGPQQENGAHSLVVQRRAGRGRVRPHDRGLQRGQVGRPDRGVDQRAEPGVHPVHGRSPAQRPLDDRTARLHPPRYVGAKTGPRLPARYVDHVVDAQRASVYQDFSHDRQLPTAGPISRGPDRTCRPGPARPPR